MAPINRGFDVTLIDMARHLCLSSLLLGLLSGCGEDDMVAKAKAKAQQAAKPAPVAMQYGPFSDDNILRRIMLLQFDDHAGMQQAIHQNAAGYCEEGKLGAGINQLPVASTVSDSRRQQSYSFAMKDALQDAMAPLDGRYRALQVKELFSGPIKFNDQTYVRTVVLSCFVKVSEG